MIRNEKPHRKLVLWKRGISFCQSIYKLTENFPGEEKYGITSQFRRAALSIPLNVAEGAGRNHPKEFIQFLGIANGSIAEIDTLLEIAMQLNYINNETFETLANELDTISSLNNGLIKKLKQPLPLTSNV